MFVELASFPFMDESDFMYIYGRCTNSSFIRNGLALLLLSSTRVIIGDYGTGHFLICQMS